MKDPVLKVLDTTLRRVKDHDDRPEGIHYQSESNIMAKYFFYALKAAIHGFPINIYLTNKSIVVIQLYKTPLRNVYRRRRKSYLKSTRDRTYMFDMKIRANFYDERFYNFRLWPQYARVLQKIINSDSVYQLIK